MKKKREREGICFEGVRVEWIFLVRINFSKHIGMFCFLKGIFWEFPLWLSRKESGWYPWRHGFNPWSHPVCSGSGVAVSCGVGHRCSSDSSLMRLWHRLAAIPVLIPSLGTSICHLCCPKKKKKGWGVQAISLMALDLFTIGLSLPLQLSPTCPHQVRPCCLLVSRLDSYMYGI